MNSIRTLLEQIKHMAETGEPGIADLAAKALGTIDSPTAEKASSLSDAAGCFRTVFDCGARTVTLYFNEHDQALAFYKGAFEPHSPTAADAGVLSADYSYLQRFHTKHALGPMAAPSCLCCGQQTHAFTRRVAIQHFELPGIVICVQCRDAAKASDRPPAVMAVDLPPFPDDLASKDFGPHTSTEVAGLMRDYARAALAARPPAMGADYQAGRLAGLEEAAKHFESDVFDQFKVGQVISEIRALRDLAVDRPTASGAVGRPQLSDIEHPQQCAYPDAPTAMLACPHDVPYRYACEVCDSPVRPTAVGAGRSSTACDDQFAQGAL